MCAKDVRTRMATHPRAVTGTWVKRPMREVLVEVALNDANSSSFRHLLTPDTQAEESDVEDRMLRCVHAHAS
jgi:hypothetical protein